MVDEQNIEGFINGDTIEVHVPSHSPMHNANTDPEIPTMTKISYDTCARMNAFLSYARVDIFIYMGQDMARLISIKPANESYVECVVNLNGETMSVIVGCWIPFIMYLRRIK